MTIIGSATEIATLVKELQRWPDAEVKPDGHEIAKGCLEAIRGTLPEKRTGA